MSNQKSFTKQINEQLKKNTVNDIDATINHILNEYQPDLHNMTMKDFVTAQSYTSEYLNILDEMEEYDGTNSDYFNYEEELIFGETN